MKNDVVRPRVSGTGPISAVILSAGVLLCAVYAVGTFFFDFFAGSATRGFGVMGEVHGTGMFFVYMIGCINALLVVLPILLVRRPGVGTAVYLPYAIIGFPVEYYFEVYLEPVLRGVWAVAGWCAIGLLIGAAADTTFALLRGRVSERWLAVACGCAVGGASFGLTLFALATFYKVPMDTGPGSFAGMAYFGVPWLLVHSVLGAYTARALSREDMVGRPIRWRMHIPVPPDRVFAALDTAEGRASFWAESATEVDGHIEFRFIDGTACRSRILERRRPQLLAIDYMDGPVRFELSSDGAGGTDLLLTHLGVGPEDWNEVHAGWLNVLFPLKAWLAHGIDLRNHDPARAWDRGYADQ